MTSLTFTVHGIPGPQGSKTRLAHGGIVESSKKVAPWRSDVKAAAEAALIASDEWERMHDGPVQVAVTFRFVRPNSHYRTGRNAHLLRDNAPVYPTGLGRGDIDKLLRSTFDALKTAGVIADDKLVAEVCAVKQWCLRGQVPGALVHLETLPIEEPF